MKSLETQIAELTEASKQDKAEITRLQGVIASADKTVAASKLVEFCKEAELPAVATEKLVAAFKDAVNTNGMQEAVNTEKKYIISLKESVATKIVRNNGAHQNMSESAPKLAEMKEAQVKAFVASGYDEATAKAMAGL